MQAHDGVAVQEMGEENVTQYLGETVKLVRLEKARDTPLVRLYESLLEHCTISVCRLHFHSFTALLTVFKVLYIGPFNILSYFALKREIRIIKTKIAMLAYKQHPGK